MRPPLRVLTVFLLLAGACPWFAAAGLRKIWELDLRTVIHQDGEPGKSALLVQGLRFSPDGTRIAVNFDQSPDPKRMMSRLLILKTEQPSDDVKQFNVNGVGDGMRGPGPGFGWSPAGDMVVLAKTLIRWKEGKTCGLPRPGTFLNQDHLLGDEFKELTLEAHSTRISLYDADCRTVGNWDSEEFRSIRDVSVDRGLVLLEESDLTKVRKVLLVDPIKKTVLRVWGPEMVLGKFADSGKAICVGQGADKPGRVPFSCWEVDTDKKIADAPTINGGGRFAPALHASRVVGDDVHVKRELFYNEYYDYVKRRVVWDFRAGKELLSWRPQVQADEHTTDPQYFAVAISPDGQYIAEGGNGVIRLYQVER